MGMRNATLRCAACLYYEIISVCVKPTFGLGVGLGWFFFEKFDIIYGNPEKGIRKINIKTYETQNDFDGWPQGKKLH